MSYERDEALRQQEATEAMIRMRSLGLHPDPLGLGEGPATQRRRAKVEEIIRDVCELPDRTSPDDQPDLLMLTVKELRIILLRHFGLE